MSNITPTNARIERPRSPAACRASRAAALALVVACAATGCAGSGSSFGLTRDASNEARRALEIECVGALAFSPDGRYFAASNGRTLCVRQSPSGRTHETLDLRDDAGGAAGAAIAFSPDGRWLASSCKGETAVKVFDTRDWKEHAMFLFTPERVGAIALSSDGSELAVGTSTSRIALCALESGAQRTLRKSRAGTTLDAAPITFLGYGSGDRTLLATAGDDAIGIDRASGDVLWSRADEHLLAVARDAHRVIIASSKSGLAQLLELGESPASDEPIVACTLHDPAGPGAALGAVFAPDDAWIGIAYARHFIGANWQELEFFRLTPNKLAKGTSAASGEKLEARAIRSLRAGEPRRMTISSDGKLLCLCTVPIAAVYETSRLLSAEDLRD